MGVGFDELAVLAWPLFLLMYGAEAVEEAKRRIEKGVIRTAEDLAAWFVRQPVDDRWNPILTPPT